MKLIGWTTLHVLHAHSIPYVQAAVLIKPAQSLYTELLRDILLASCPYEADSMKSQVLHDITEFTQACNTQTKFVEC